MEIQPSGFEKEALETPDDMGPEMYDFAKAAGAYIHSDSWGGNTPAYDVQVNQVDTYAWNNLNFLPMFAAGNEGEDAEAASPEDSSGIQYTYTDGRGTLGNPTNAKNCISVGAALSDNSEAIDNSMLATKLGELLGQQNRLDVAGRHRRLRGRALEQCPHPRLSGRTSRSRHRRPGTIHSRRLRRSSRILSIFAAQSPTKPR